MRFVKAKKGVSKIFVAAILMLIAAAAGGIASTFLIAAGYSSVNHLADEANSRAAVFLVAGAIAAVLIVVAGIFNIIGYIQAARDEEGFRKAIFCTIISLILYGIAGMTQNQDGFVGWLGTVIYTVAGIFNLMVTIFSIGGLMSLSDQCMKPEMVQKGRNILRVIVWIYILYFIVFLLTKVFRESDFSNALAGGCSVAALILMIVQYVLYLIYLGKASKMLKEAK